MLGRLLDGRYQVTEVLSSGGFSRTYIAEDTRRPGNPKCVVKELMPASNDPNTLEIARRLFNAEAEMLEKLGDHNQIPRLLAYFEENQDFYLVQELIIGKPLIAELTPGQRWTELQVIEMLQDVLTTLKFVHDNHVIHRDIKPENLIRRSQDGKLVLIDFGAVKQVSNTTVKGEITSTVAIGTPGYMPAEQSQGKPRPNSDIYALGKIAIQALTGLYQHQLQEDPDTGETIWEQHTQVRPGLAKIVNKMVRYYYRNRYQSATEIIQELQQLKDTLLRTQPVRPSGRTIPVTPRNYKLSKTVNIFRSIVLIGLIAAIVFNKVILSIIVALAGFALLSVRFFYPSLTRNYDICFATMLILYSLIIGLASLTWYSNFNLVFWCQLLLSGAAIFAITESVHLRSAR